MKHNPTSHESIIERLYRRSSAGFNDLAFRLASNAKLGNLDFEETISAELRLQEGKTLLDVGCGTGKHLERFQKEYGIVPYGVDLLETQLVCKSINFTRCSADDLPFVNGLFDRIMCNYALYYVGRWQKAVVEMLRVLRADGRMLISGPAKNNNMELYRLHKSLFGEISPIDQVALQFIEGNLEPYLSRYNISFEARTYVNCITYPTEDDFLDYYISTNLFKMTAQKFSAEEILKRIARETSRIYCSELKFENTKRVRVVVIQA